MRVHQSITKLAFYGLSLSNFGSEDEDWNGERGTYSNKAGFVNLGASIWLPNLIPHTLVEPGLRLTSKGEVEEFDYYGEWTYKTSTNLLYLELFGKARLAALPMPLYPFVGFSTGFLLSANRKIEMDGESNSVDIKDAYNAVDFGLLFGFDYIIENRVTLGFEYNLGLSNVCNVMEFVNRTMLFTIGYLF